MRYTMHLHGMLSRNSVSAQPRITNAGELFADFTSCAAPRLPLNTTNFWPRAAADLSSAARKNRIMPTVTTSSFFVVLPFRAL